jgi:anti-sigma factor ChrR (cupin superfamily)
MALYYKKVDAIQFTLTDEEKELIKQRKPVLFEGAPVKHAGGDSYIAVLQQGENLIRVYNSQWVVRHPDGQYQIVWPDRFAALFTKGNDTDTIKIAYDPFSAKSYNQPNVII